jgi:hypothetical protein
MKTKTPRLAPALVVVGAVLAIVGLFAPWYRLYTTFGDTPGEQLVGPWTALHDGVVAPVSMALGCFLPVALLLASSVASVFIRAPQWRDILGKQALLLATTCLALALLALWVAPQSIPLDWPYYTIRGVEYGPWAAIAGFACVALGVLLGLRVPMAGTADRPATRPDGQANRLPD